MFQLGTKGVQTAPALYLFSSAADAVLLDSYLKNNISVAPHCIFPLNRAKHESRQWKNEYRGEKCLMLLENGSLARV